MQSFTGTVLFTGIAGSIWILQQLLTYGLAILWAAPHGEDIPAKRKNKGRWRVDNLGWITSDLPPQNYLNSFWYNFLSWSPLALSGSKCLTVITVNLSNLELNFDVLIISKLMAYAQQNIEDNLSPQKSDQDHPEENRFWNGEMFPRPDCRKGNKQSF